MLNACLCRAASDRSAGGETGGVSGAAADPGRFRLEIGRRSASNMLEVPQHLLAVARAEAAPGAQIDAGVHEPDGPITEGHVHATGVIAGCG